MQTILKAARREDTAASSPADVREAVATIIADVRARGDVAVRECSERFDRWSPERFRLAPDRDRADRRRRPATGPRRHPDGAGEHPRLRPGPARRAPRLRGRDDARRLPRAAEHPRLGRWRVHPGWPLSARRLGPHDDRHRQGRRCRAGDRVHPADRGRDPGGDGRGDALRRRGRDLPPRRRAGRGGDGDRDRDDRPGRHARRARERLRGRGEAPAVRRGRDRPVRRADGDPDRRRRIGRPVHRRGRPAQPGRARAGLACGPHHDLGGRSAARRSATSSGSCRTCRPATTPDRPGATTAR